MHDRAPVIWRFQRFELDMARRQLRGDAQPLHLTPKAFDLLATLVAAAPRVVPKSELHQRLWPCGVVTDATLVALVKEVRRALDDTHPETPLIRTAHRIGYAFEARVDQVREAPRAREISRWLIVGERRFALLQGENIIGRDPDVNIWLDLETISRRHARLLASDAGVVLEDLGSKNGTSVEGKRITSAHTLGNGQRFVCGRLHIIYRESGADLPTATELSRIVEPHAPDV
jgi:DNA-binding winged helix-turn-helix (wHTH) protein